MNHECYCLECAQGGFYVGPSLGFRHCSFRLANAATRQIYANLRVLCNGIEIKHCFECFTGMGGGVSFYVDVGDGIHLCKRCGRGACARTEFGDVIIEEKLQEAVL